MRIAFIALIAATYALAAGAPALAQVQVAGLPGSGEEEAFSISLVSEYRDAQTRIRSQAWWKDLEDEISLPSNLSFTYVRAADLQPLILFATLHGDKVDLTSSVPPLVDTYRHHPDPQVRIMALVALHAVRAEEGYAAMREQLDVERHPRVVHMTRAALEAAAR